MDPSVILNGINLTAVVAFGTHQWLDCDNNYAAIPGETSQNFTPSTNGNYALELTQDGCSDTSECYSIESKPPVKYILLMTL